jgi:hypothetical protein
MADCDHGVCPSGRNERRGKKLINLLPYLISHLQPILNILDLYPFFGLQTRRYVIRRSYPTSPLDIPRSTSLSPLDRRILIDNQEYPLQPPKMIFDSEMWHPNVYATSDRKGEVCISILVS